MEETPPKEPRKIRLTRAEAYAISLPGKRKKKVTFTAIGLLVAAALGYTLWHFQEFWLPYWLPNEEPTPEVATATDESTASTPTLSPTESEPVVAAPEERPLDYLSAAIWNHPRFHQGVKLFNQALDAQRAFQRAPVSLHPLVQAEENTLQAIELFTSLKEISPTDVPLDEYISTTRRLVLEGRRLARDVRTAQAAATAQEQETPTPAPAATAKAPPLKPGEPWQHPDFLEGARLFNQALEQYKAFQADKSRMDLLKPIEDDCFQAAKKFEALRAEAPEGVPLNQYITQCYRLISDCRRQNLESGGLVRTGTAVSPKHNRPLATARATSLSSAVAPRPSAPKERSKRSGHKEPRKR